MTRASDYAAAVLLIAGVAAVYVVLAPILRGMDLYYGARRWGAV